MTSKVHKIDRKRAKRESSAGGIGTHVDKEEEKKNKRGKSWKKKKKGRRIETRRSEGERKRNGCVTAKELEKKGAHGPCTIMCVLVFINRDTCTNAIDTVHVCVSFFFYVMRSRESKSFDKSTYQTVETKQKKCFENRKKKNGGKKKSRREEPIV